MSVSRLSTLSDKAILQGPDKSHLQNTAYKTASQNGLREKVSRIALAILLFLRVCAFVAFKIVIGGLYNLYGRVKRHICHLRQAKPLPRVDHRFIETAASEACFQKLKLTPEHMMLTLGAIKVPPSPQVLDSKDILIFFSDFIFNHMVGTFRDENGDHLSTRQIYMRLEIAFESGDKPVIGEYEANLISHIILHLQGLKQNDEKKYKAFMAEEMADLCQAFLKCKQRLRTYLRAVYRQQIGGGSLRRAELSESMAYELECWRNNLFEGICLEIISAENQKRHSQGKRGKDLLDVADVVGICHFELAKELGLEEQERIESCEQKRDHSLIVRQVRSTFFKRYTPKEIAQKLLSCAIPYYTPTGVLVQEPTIPFKLYTDYCLKECMCSHEDIYQLDENAIPTGYMLMPMARVLENFKWVSPI